MTEHLINSPGDPDAPLLLTRAQVLTGTVMHLETGKPDEVLYLELEGRTIADVNERLTVSYAMTYAQAGMVFAEMLKTAAAKDPLAVQILANLRTGL